MRRGRDAPTIEADEEAGEEADDGDVWRAGKVSEEARKSARRSTSSLDGAPEPVGSRRSRCLRCAFTRAERTVLWVVFVLLFGGGGYLLTEAAVRLEALKRSTVCQCTIKDFQAMQTFVEHGEVAPTCSTMVGLVVAAACPAAGEFRGGVLFIQNWMPEYIESYHSEAGSVPLHDAFRCCPPALTDMCAFEEQGQYCDNFGRLRPESGCPATPWPCYFVDLQAKLDEKRDLYAEELMFGDPQATAYTFAACGAPIIFLSLLVMLVLTKAIWMSCLRRLLTRLFVAIRGERKASGRTGQQQFNFAFEIARLLPPELRSRRMSDLVFNHFAAVIQRNVRGHLARAKFRELILRLTKEGDDRLIILKADGHAADVLDPSRVMARIARRFEKGKYPDMIAPPSVGPKPLRGLLYDTGDSKQFRRLVASRVVSTPGEKVERMEVAFQELAEDMDRLFRVTSKDSGNRLLISKKPSHHMATAYGFREGQLVIKVNELSWPATDGHRLFLELKPAARPVFLLLEGRPVHFEAEPDNISLRRSQPLYSPSASPVSSPVWSPSSTSCGSPGFRRPRPGSSGESWRLLRQRTGDSEPAPSKAADGMLLPGEVPKPERVDVGRGRSSSPLPQPPLMPDVLDDAR